MEEHSMSAYIIVEAVITHPDAFAAYAKAVPPVVAQYGGEYKILGGQASALEGEWGATKIVMHEWPSVEAAKAFWYSEEYAKIKPLREGTGEFRVILVDGRSSQKLES
jgi:uncharacterized protein (DUF1330 family)